MAVLIEVIAQSVTDAIEAEAGGAGRLELVRDLDQDGLTPPPELVRAVCRAVGIPVYVMVRPWDRFTLSPEEREVVAEEARIAVEAGAHGIVLGYVAGSGDVDEEALSAVKLAVGPDVGFTFHRAFDRLMDPMSALPRLAGFGIGRVLTSGGARVAPEGIPSVQSLVPAASRHGITVMAGGGLTPENVSAVVGQTGVTEVHLGGGVRVPPSPTAPVSRERVAAVRQALNSIQLGD